MRSEAIMFQHLFFIEASPQGWKKKAMLCQHRIICLDQPSNPPYRLTRETIQRLIAEHKESTIRQMRLCAHGAELAEEYAKMTEGRWGVDILFNDIATLSIPQVFPDYQPEFGLDADIFLLIDDEDRPVYHIEIFPREKVGEAVTAYGSKLQFVVPFKTSRDKEIFDDLGGIIFAGVGAEGESFEEATERWVKLEAGLWKIIETEAVMMFVHCACFSYIEHTCPEPKEMVGAGFSRSLDDRRNKQAVLRRTMSS